MPANVENSAVSTGLEKVSFHSDPKERQCQRMLNYYTIALISHTSKVMLKILQAKLQLWTSRCSGWIYNRQRNHRSNCQHLSDHWKSKRAPEKIYLGFIDYAKAFDCVDHNKFCKILKEKGIPENLTCLLRNLYAGQEATIRTGHGTTD